MTDGSMPQFGQRKEIYISKTMCCIHLPCCWSFVTHTVAPSTTAIMTYYICIPVTIFPSVATFNSRNSSNQIHTVISLSWLLYMVYNSGQYRTTPCPPPQKKPIYLCYMISCKSDHSAKQLLHVFKNSMIANVSKQAVWCNTQDCLTITETLLGSLGNQLSQALGCWCEEWIQPQLSLLLVGLPPPSRGSYAFL